MGPDERGGRGGPPPERRRGDRNGPDRGGEAAGRRRRGAVVGWARRAAATVAAAGSWAVRTGDSVLAGLERGGRRARDGLLRAFGLRPERVTVAGVVEGSPGPVREAVEKVASVLELARRQLDRALPFLPRERAWRRAAAGVGLLLAAVALGPLTGGPEARPLPGARRPIFVGYFENGWSPLLRDSFPTLQRHWELVDIVMPFWHSVRPDGSVEDRGVRTEVIDFARAHGLAVVPLFNNAKVPESAAFLASEEGRRRAVRNISALVEKWGYDGVHIDFELLPPRLSEGFSLFLAELRGALGPARHLSAAVIPKVDVHPEIHGLYDYAEMARSCDFIVLMAYDRHWATSKAGPISPLGWVEENIVHALSEWGVPPEKVVLGVGGYGLDWPEGGGKDRRASVVPAYAVEDIARRHGASIRWDAESENPHFSYYSGSTRRDVWYQDERVMAQRVALVLKYRLRGLALWRMGYETPGTWTVLRDSLGPR